MGTYRLSCEIEVFEGESPLDAAQRFERLIREDGHMQYYVQDESNNKLYSVDLDECEGSEELVVETTDYQPVIKI